LENTGRQLADSVNSVTNPAGHTSAERPSSQAPLPDSQAGAGTQSTGSAANVAGSATAAGRGTLGGAPGSEPSQQPQQPAAGERSASPRAAGVWDARLSRRPRTVPGTDAPPGARAHPCDERHARPPR